MNRLSLRRIRIAAFVIAMAGIVIAQPRHARAEIHALVVGFNDYAHAPKLKGAVFDAADIAGALRKRGVRDVVEINSAGARVGDFRRSWSEIVGRARRDDLILFSFAGHGIRLPEKREPKRTPDGYEKGFIFPSYEQDKRPDEILRDEDLYDLFQATAAKGFRILFLVDACHAGSGIRAADSRSGGTKRFMTFTETSDALPVAPQLAAPRPPIPSVAVITAQAKEKSIQEYPIDGQPRGALSYAFARGLEGAADPEHTGTIRFDDLYQFIRTAVRTRSEYQQAPEVLVRDADRAMPILSDAASGTAPVAVAEAKDVALYSLGAPPAAPLRHTRIVADKAQADMIWDPQRRQLLDGAGDVLISDFNESRLQDAVDARRLLLVLRKTGELRGGLTVSLQRAGAAADADADRFYTAGTRLQFSVQRGGLPALSVLNISADGNVQLLFPRNRDEERTAGATLPVFDVRPPFGADYAVFVESDAPLRLYAQFGGPDFQAPAAAVQQMLGDTLTAGKMRIGIQGLYTCRSMKANGQCDNMF